MSWLSLISLALRVLQGLIQGANQRGLLDAGAKGQLADSLLQTARMVADGKKIAEWVSRQSDVDLDAILSERYTRD